MEAGSAKDTILYAPFTSRVVVFDNLIGDIDSFPGRLEMGVKEYFPHSISFSCTEDDGDPLSHDRVHTMSDFFQAARLLSTSEVRQCLTLW